MIKPTRVTVDQATHDVLYQLSTQLAQAPAWTATLLDSIHDGFREGTKQSQTATNRLIEPLVAANRMLQGQLTEQEARLVTLLDLVRAVEARITAQQQSMPEAVHQLLQDLEQHQRDSQAEQVQVLTALFTSVQALEPRVVAQQEALEVQQQDLVKLLSSEEKTQVAVAKHHAMLEAVQHLMQDAERRQRDSQAEQVQVLTALSTLVQALEPRIVAQHRALEAQQQKLVKLLSADEQTQAAVTKHNAMLETVQHQIQEAERHQRDSQSEQTQAQAVTHALLREMQSEQARQLNELSSICQRLNVLSTPWWKKIFKRNRSQNS